MSNKGKRLTLQEAAARLRLLDDEMMRTALKDQIELVQFILRIILRKPGLIVKRIETQRDLIQLGEGRSVALDVWAEDTDGTEYDIEIQRLSKGADPYRVRYHFSVMDATNLKTRENYKQLPRTKVIVMAEADALGMKKLIDSFVYRNKDGKELDTGQEAIYVNTAYKGEVAPDDKEIAALAHDFRCADPEDRELEPIRERMRFLKNTEKGRAQMSSVVQQYAEQYAEEHKDEIGQKYAEEHRDEIVKEYVADHRDQIGKEYVDEHRDEILMEFIRTHPEEVAKQLEARAAR